MLLFVKFYIFSIIFNYKLYIFIIVLCIATEHEAFVDTNKEVIGTILFGFIFDNKSLNIKQELSKLTTIDTNASKVSKLISKNDYLSMNKITKLINKSDKKLLFKRNEKLFRLNLVNYCCIKYLKYGNDGELITYMTDNIQNGWIDIELESIETVCKSPGMIVCFKS